MISILGLRIDLDWFHNSADRDLIHRWTVGKEGETRRHELTIEGMPAPEPEWCFLVLGDSGDSARFGSRISPQRAVATIMAQDCGLLQETPEREPIPGAPPMQLPACMVLHTGDVNYLTGEQRLYDLNFIDPYRPFQTTESHYNDLVFRIPFLPVPGNHDYYDLHGWTQKVMTIGSWVGLSKLLTHFFYRLGLPVPFGGSNMGASYMGAFVEQNRDAPQPLPYRPGSHTKLPNRYYQFRVGNVHFFALDSNTLDAPPPGDEDPWKEKASAIVESNERKLGRLNEQVEHDREWEQQEATRQREAMRSGQREELWPRLQQLLSGVATSAEALSAATNRWAETIAGDRPDDAKHLKDLAQKNHDLQKNWLQILTEVSGAPQPVAAYETRLDDLINLQESWLRHFVERDKFTVTLPGAPEYEAARVARLGLDASLGQWCRERVGESLPGPCAQPACEDEEDTSEEADLIQVDLSEAILDTQRDLALARKLSDRNEDDYDSEQIEWLRTGLAAVKAEEAERQSQDPAARIWRIVYLHHPLYTTTPSHAEHGDSVGVRHNLEEILKDADVVIAGHSHGFEWLHSSAAPHQCYLVTGAGGQNRLQGSIFSTQLAVRYGAPIESLTNAGLDSLIWASGDPTSMGATVEHKLFSYLRVRVLPEELRVEPVGVRQLHDAADHEDDRWERVYPMPVHEVSDPSAWRESGNGPTRIRLLDHIKIRRGERPVTVWAE
jgi:hypothetical protein